MGRPNRKVIRLEQMRAQRATAAGIKYVDVVFENQDGIEETCTLLTQDHWPVEAIEAAGNGDGNANIKVLRDVATDPAAFDRLITVAHLTLGELTALLEQLDGEAGTTAGEDSSSSPSSESMPELSEPTSSATTPVAA